MPSPGDDGGWWLLPLAGRYRRRGSASAAALIRKRALGGVCSATQVTAATSAGVASTVAGFTTSRRSHAPRSANMLNPTTKTIRPSWVTRRRRDKEIVARSISLSPRLLVSACSARPLVIRHSIHSHTHAAPPPSNTPIGRNRLITVVSVVIIARYG